jgi:hypothetical protein
VTVPIIHASVTRLAQLGQRPPTWEGVPRARWRTGDFVVAEVVGETSLNRTFEAADGRMVEAAPGDLVVGALGERAATLEIVGSWRDVGDDLRLDSLTRGGVLGRITSAALGVRDLVVNLAYRGHLLVDGSLLAMRDVLAPAPAPVPASRAPVVLIIGTSMSAGKTTAAKVIIRALRRRGLIVAGAKLTGVARYADILGMADAGAAPVLDFVDAGLPSTIGPPEQTAAAVARMRDAVAAADADVLVAEAGASPLEPYNGEAAVLALGQTVRCTVLCAHDPYAVVGITRSFGLEPDLVAGYATATSAARSLLARLSDAPALDLLDPSEAAALDDLLARQLGLA